MQEKRTICLSAAKLNQFEEEGFVIIERLLDPGKDLQPVVDEYGLLLDQLAEQWWKEGKLTSAFSGLPFCQRLIHIAAETKGQYYQHLDISLPLEKIQIDSPMHHGPAVFDLLRNPKLLDAIECFIGPEIFCNPVQHVRIKPPEKFLPKGVQRSPAVGQTDWHQDLGVIAEDGDESNILTIWIPMLDVSSENGCLRVQTGSHQDGLALHCLMNQQGPGIPAEYRRFPEKTVPMRAGDVLFLTKLTMHSSLPNRSNQIRWSFDLRYNPIGQSTGRSCFPGFIARSRSHPEQELKDPLVWADLWRVARSRLATTGTPNLRRWDSNDPLCA